MLNRWRLPRDNFPDDTERRAFQRYRDDGRYARFSLRGWPLRRWLAFAVPLLAVTAAVIYLVLPEAEPTLVVVPGDTPATLQDPVQALDAVFPSDVTDRRTIRLPARITDQLPVAHRRGYFFNASAGVTWCLTVDADPGFVPSVSFFGVADGSLVTEVGDCAPESGALAVELLITFQQDGPYAVLVADEAGLTGGAYTLRLIPA